MGYKISDVNYEYTLKDVADWTKSAEVQTAFPAIAKNINTTISSKATLVLTNNGWQSDQLVK